jgi:hypothetical protein
MMPITRSNLKPLLVLIVAAISAGITYIVQHHQADLLRQENRDLIAKQEKLAKERDSALESERSRTNELEQLRKHQNELLRLRGELSQLRRQLEPQKAQAGLQPAVGNKAPQAVSHAPGSYIGKDELAPVGYATPEAALETITWAMINGTYEQMTEGASPEIVAGELKDPKGREQFEAGQKMLAPVFKGMQILAKKTLEEDRVELKIKQDYDPAMNQLGKMLGALIQPMVRVGTEWKLGGSTREYQQAWEKDAQIQTFTP